MSSGISFQEALELTRLHDKNDILELVERANQVRKTYRGNTVDLCSIVNAKSGRCEEDCVFCAQSARYTTHVDVCDMKSVEAIVDHAKAAEEAGAHRFCIVTKGRSLPPGDFEIALRATERIAQETSLKRCASMGLLDGDRAQALKEAGLCRYNHNLETAKSRYPYVCTTHTYEDRVATIMSLKRAGIETCVGGILNMGETEQQRIELAFELKQIEPDSVPMNFLNPRPGTPLSGEALLAPLEAVKYIAIYRLVMPKTIIRIAGGRAENLRDLQPLGVKAGADGLLIGNYLTTIGVDPSQDLAMLRELGLDVSGKWQPCPLVDGYHQTSFLTSELARLREEGLFRDCCSIEGEQASYVRIAGRPTIMLSSNNYLGLATHPKLKEAAKEAIDLYGCGAGASRLIAGNMELHERLEERIARFKGTEAALVFNSGYAANVGVLSAVVGQGDVILSDALNHASIIDGCRLSKAETKVYPHKDMTTLEVLLAQSKSARRKLIVTDGVFSMDGDIAPLPDIVHLARKHGALIMVDDAHATGVLGRNGRGLSSFFGLEGAVDIEMGTLSKALGCVGAYVAGSRELKEFLINKCRTFIFTTAPPPSVTGSALAAFDLLESEPWRREVLHTNAAFLRQGLRDMGYDCADSKAQIIPVVIGDSTRTMLLSHRLLQLGVYARGIRPPTVPEGTSRLRVTVMATHSQGDLEQALDAFRETGRELKLID